MAEWRTFDQLRETATHRREACDSAIVIVQDDEQRMAETWVRPQGLVISRGWQRIVVVNKVRATAQR